MTAQGIVDFSKALLDYYDQHLAAHGDSARGAAWPDEAGRLLRFRIGLDIVLEHAGTGPLTLCDLGCGTGELLRFIGDAGLGPRIRYVGIDRSEHAIRLARDKFPEATFHCVDLMACPAARVESLLDCDFVFANGLFTVKHTLDQADMWRFLRAMVGAAWPRVRRGIVFNVMSKTVDWERDDLFHVSYDELAVYLRRLGGHEIGFRAHRDLHELMAFAVKDHVDAAAAATRSDTASVASPVAIPVYRPLLPPAKALLPYLAQADIERRYTNHGSLSQELTRRIAHAVSADAGNVCLAASGTAALTAAVLAVAGRATPDKPLAFCPAYTFVASALALELAGYTPVLLDVDADTWALTPSAAASRPLAGVGVVVVTAPYGRAFDQDGWLRFSRETGIPVVIDGAAAFEAVCADPRAMLGGAPVVLSFHATKAFSTGEGGAVLCTDEDVVRRAAVALNFGFEGTRQCASTGFNGKLSEYHAAVGLAELDGWTARQAALRQVAHLYRDGALRHGLDDRIIVSPRIASCYALFQAATAAEAHAVELALQSDGLDCRRWYGAGVQGEPHFRNARCDALPTTLGLAPRLLGLPMAPDLRPGQVDRILAAVAVGVASGSVAPPHAASPPASLRGEHA